ncbi:MAG: hypothetical protein IIZ62_07165, partial [Ruminococcus sp.]|nr:hypothetical protein [Ruminococcus sp.]
ATPATVQCKARTPTAVTFLVQAIPLLKYKGIAMVFMTVQAKQCLVSARPAKNGMNTAMHICARK